MPQHDSKTNRGSKDKESEIMEFIIDALKDHEKRIERAISNIEQLTKLISSNVRKLNLNSEIIAEKLTNLEEEIKEINKKAR